VEAEGSVRIVPRFDAYQTVVVGPVVSVLPVLEVRVGPVRVHSPRPPRMHHPPRLLKPASRGLPLGDRSVGVDDYRVLEQEELVAMDEGKYILGIDCIPKGWRIPREEVAEFALDQLEDDRYLGRSIAMTT
jgi:hypothetical protein